jgi:hypothetical protein
MLHGTTRAIAGALVATLAIATPLAAAEGLGFGGPYPLRPIGDAIIGAYTTVVEPVDDMLDGLLLDTTGSSMEATREAGYAAGDVAMAAVDEGNAQAQGLPAAAGAGTGAGQAAVGAGADGANDAADAIREAAVDIGFAASATSHDANGRLDRSAGEGRAFGERRTAGAHGTEAAVLEPLPGAIMDAYRTIPDPRIPIVVDIPRENPDLTGGTDLLAEPYLTNPQLMLARAVDYSGELQSAPPATIVVAGGYLGHSAAAVQQGANDAAQDTAATAQALVAILAP